MSFDDIARLTGSHKERVFPHQSRPEVDYDPAWSEKVRKNKDGVPRPTLENAALILGNLDGLRGRIWLNQFTDKEMITGPLPHEDSRKPRYEREINDCDLIEIRLMLQGMDVFVSSSDSDAAVARTAKMNVRHPVQEYLRKLRWDGERRIDRFLVDYFGCDDNEYVRAVSGKFLISAIARVLNPGEKVDTMLIIEGKQGLGKSRGIRELMPRYEWFSEMSIDPDSKDTIEVMQGKWIIEYAELAGMSKRESNSMKKFLATQVDDIRKSYARKPVRLPRQCIFVGTTNDSQYLVDETGDRRYWPVHATKIDVDGIAAIRDQLWAEARDMWLCGAEWHLTPEEEHAADEVRGVRKVVDIWESPVLEYVNGRDEVTSREVMEGALFLPLKEMHSGNARRVKIILEGAGYKQIVARRGGRPTRVYVTGGAE